jgi:hypothetical protein
MLVIKGVMILRRVWGHVSRNEFPSLLVVVVGSAFCTNWAFPMSV